LPPGMARCSPSQVQNLRHNLLPTPYKNLYYLQEMTGYMPFEDSSVFWIDFSQTLFMKSPLIIMIKMRSF